MYDVIGIRGVFSWKTDTKKGLLFAYSNYTHWGLQLLWRAASQLHAESIILPRLPRRERDELPWSELMEKWTLCLLENPDYLNSKNVQLGWKAWNSISQNGKWGKALIQIHFYGADQNILE